MRKATPDISPQDILRKTPTGIAGLDEITQGGLPQGRPTLICGSSGCGKTIFGLEFLVNGIRDCGEAGVFLAFEETVEDLVRNVSSLGFDLRTLEETNRLIVDYVHVDRNQIAVAGAYDLEGLFIRLQASVDAIGAKRVVIDTLETIFTGFDNIALLRTEVRRLFRWFKERELTVVITAEQGEGQFTRQGLEEYVSDCVITLDHRVNDQLSTRRLRVVKYRGSVHGTNEYPFLIDDQGISVLPLSALGLNHQVSNERVPSGVAKLDEMLEGKGYYRGSTILVSGTAGSGKTSLSCILADATCRSGERCLYFAFEESPAQIMRNMGSIGLNLQQWLDKGLLKFHASRPSLHGLEMHLVQIMRLVSDFKPSLVILDPISNMISMGSSAEINSILIRLIDHLKTLQITTFFTNLTAGEGASEATDIGVSSLIDTWLLVRDIESSGERNRGLYVLKSRGMAHSNQIREFQLTDNGINLQEVYLGPGGVLTGSLRLSQENKETATSLLLDQEISAQQMQLERKRKAMEARVAALQAELMAEEEEVKRHILIKKAEQKQVSKDRSDMSQRRLGGPESNGYGALKEAAVSYE
jgi:circadian clock protein KaiC